MYIYTIWDAMQWFSNTKTKLQNRELRLSFSTTLPERKECGVRTVYTYMVVPGVGNRFKLSIVIARKIAEKPSKVSRAIQLSFREKRP